jgi:hypothetical protein
MNYYIYVTILNKVDNIIILENFLSCCLDIPIVLEMDENLLEIKMNNKLDITACFICYQQLIW